MRYVSTRGDAPEVGFVDAVLAGLAPDGGLYMPEAWPQLTPQEIAGFAGRTYADVCAEILFRFAGKEIDRKVIDVIAAEAYASFSHAAVTPLVQLGANRYLLELFHGPSLAFKDVAMQLIARLYDHLLHLQRRRLTILCATSGDTGGAAVEAFRGGANVKVVALFPEGRISEVQRRFMTAAPEANVRCLAIKGDFDDCQAIVKACFQDQSLRQAVDLSGVKSINFARIIAQIVYYFTSAVSLGAPHRPVAFSVPSGNFGDAFAGYGAWRMGLPIERILVATNSNDILARTFETGRYARGPAQPTQSPAMDIQSASNFERLYFEGVERNGLETARAFAAFSGTGAFAVPPRALDHMRQLFTGLSVSEAETAKTMLVTLNETGQLIDPHTAIGVAAAKRGLVAAHTPLVVLSTAHPAKFPDTVQAATGVLPDLPSLAAGLAAKPERFDRLPADVEAVKAYVRDFGEAA
jgi:threonine synthase